jgi:UDP-N-acetylglucosamine 2-epimerase
MFKWNRAARTGPLDYKPQMVPVVGDVNSRLAAALTAVKLGIRAAHIEAALRSFDMTMPEEINRKLTDAVSDLLFVTEQGEVENLKHEGVPVEKIFLAGNVMIDCLLRYQELASKFSTSWACVRVDRDAALTECSPCTGPQMWGIQDPARNSQRS